MTHDRWSYQVTELGNTFMGPPKPQVIQDKLNQMGQSGWELVNIVQGFKVVLFFQAQALNALS